MKWILYIMLFSTPAVTVKGPDSKCLAMSTVADIDQIGVCRGKFEAKHVWSLQTSSTLNFSLFESCVRAQDKLIAESNVASTMTLRTWCICEADSGKKCPAASQLHDAVAKIRDCEVKELKGGKDAADCQNSNSAHMDSLIANGTNSSSIRLYPP